jgi:hypothetical protein
LSQVHVGGVCTPEGRELASHRTLALLFGDEALACFLVRAVIGANRQECHHKSYKHTDGGGAERATPVCGLLTSRLPRLLFGEFAAPLLP